jgi:hypothetical protein
LNFRKRMNPKLQRILDRVEAERSDLLEALSTLSDQRFNAHPSPGKWSISQIVTHIITSERLTLLYMKKKSLGVDQLDDSGWLESLKMILLRVSQRLPFLAFKAPRVVVEHTPEPLSYEEAVKKWNTVRTAMKEFLEGIDEKHVRKKIYKHPIAGRLDAAQALEFCGEHIRHHLPQIQRLMK